jgi:GTPase SAR1 family protein
MIVYITGASGSGKTTLLKSLSVKRYDLDDIYENNWKKHKRIDTVQKGVIKDINILLSEHKNIVFVGLQGKDNLPFTPDVVYILIRKDYEQYYRDKLVRDLNLLCKYKNEFEEVLKKKPFDEFRNNFWSNDIVNMKSFDEFKKYVEKMNNSIKKDFPTAEILTASEIIKKIKTLNTHGSKPSDSP